jgi:1,4-alpha-glucan branching enzyme
MATTPAPTVSRADIDQIVRADHWDPFLILGQHETNVDGKPARVIRAFLPEASEAWVVDLSKGEPGRRIRSQPFA